MTDILEVDLDEDYQDIDIPDLVRTELLENCNVRHRLIVGGRGKAASWSIARILLAEGMGEPLFIPCVREIQKTIKLSVKKLLEEQIKLFGWDDFYTSTDTEIRGANGTLFSFHGLHDYNADSIKALEGADRCWVAEAQVIGRNALGILRPTIRKDGSVIWYDLNPRYETDPVYIDYVIKGDIDAKVLKMTWRDNPWFTKALKSELRADYARDELEARHIWEGELRDAGDKFVCPSRLVDPAMNRVISTMEGPIVVGADIAHQGGDEIVFYKRIGGVTIAKYFARYQNAVKTTEDLKLFMTDRSVVLNIDNGSLGMAVADLMEAAGFIVNRINFGGKPKDPEHYEDTVTEMYFELKDKLIAADIPSDEELRAQLIQRKYAYINGRRGYEVMKIESKKEFATHATMKRKSPDRADALVLCYYEPGEQEGFAETLDYNFF